MKPKVIVFGLLAVVALGLTSPARAGIFQPVDVYETGQDQQLPFSPVGGGYVVLMEQPTNDNLDTSNWSDIAYFFNVYSDPLNADKGAAPSQPSESFVHLYSNTPGPAFADLAAFLPAVQSAANSVFLVENPSGITEYLDGLYRFHEGNVTPEPGTASSALLGLAGLGLVALVRRRS